MVSYDRKKLFVFICAVTGCITHVVSSVTFLTEVPQFHKMAHQLIIKCPFSKLLLKGSTQKVMKIYQAS